MSDFMVALIGFGVGYLVCMVVAHVVYSGAMRRIQEDAARRTPEGTEDEVSE